MAGPALITGDVLRMTIVGKTDQGSLVENVSYWKVGTTSGSSASVTDAADAWMAAATADYVPAVSEHVQFLRVDAQGIVVATGKAASLAYSSPFPANTLGAITGDPLPPITCLSVVLRSPVPGSRGRGRQQLFPTGESQNTASGHPLAGYRTLCLAWADRFVQSLLAGTGGNTAILQCGVYSRTYFSIGPVLQATVSEEWGTMRTRKTGRGV